MKDALFVGKTNSAAFFFLFNISAPACNGFIRLSEQNKFYSK